MSATDNGAQDIELSAGLSDDQAADEFLKRFMPPDADKEQPSGKEEAKTQERTVPEKNEADERETPEDGEEGKKKPDAEEGEEGEDGEDEGKRKYADDDGVYTKIKVGDEEHEVAIKDLKRLYGQEASLTKKSMEVAEQRKNVDGEMQRASAATVALLERAKARFEPYSKIDFLLASRELEPEQYMALRNEAQSAYDDVQFLGKHLDTLMSGVKQKQETDLVSAARESLKVLSGPVEQGGIEGWNEKLYDEIRAFAITEGAPADTIGRVVDSWAIKLMHQAMLYKRGLTKGQVVTTKVNKTPKKVIKTTVSSEAASGKSNADRSDKAMKRLRTSGSTDDAADAFLARWTESD